MSETMVEFEDVEEVEEVEVEAPDMERIPRWRQSTCPKSNEGHRAIPNPKRRGPYDADYLCAHCGKDKWTPMEIETLITNLLLREDANRELCRSCCEEHGADTLPYGEETGQVEWTPQFNKEGEPILDDAGDLLYVAYPELQCERGHRWYKGEGPRRDIRGPNPILFEAHLYNRKRRELLATDGVVDPAYTMDRWGKRPTVGMYVRSHPLGRKTNSPEQRKESGAGFYK